jgi:hypothetical protein
VNRQQHPTIVGNKGVDPRAVFINNFGGDSSAYRPMWYCRNPRLYPTNRDIADLPLKVVSPTHA